MLQNFEIGGGTVRRTFKMGDSQVFSGRALTAEEIMRMPATNRQALIDKQFIVVYPKAAAAVASAASGERHVVSAGFGRFNVIEGCKLNDEPLSKDEAQALAGKKAKKKK